MTPLENARVSLEGLSVGDAFGETFFFTDGVHDAIAARKISSAPWFWTDDTAMAVSIFESLREDQHIDTNKLIAKFAEQFINDPQRGYGPGMYRTLRAIHRGEPWEKVTIESFSGMGSWGNGAAMRVAPLGAYFADDLEKVISEATLSARVTHAHPEGIAGAIAVAIAAALATRQELSGMAFLEKVIEYTPESEVRSKLLQATKFTEHTPIETAIQQLGVGWEITAQDTVPYCIWCATKHLENFVEAMWYTVSGLGDRDTTCAIVGGIVAARVGWDNIPIPWRDARESLQIWEST